METRSRCTWAKKPLDILYHDEEWGVPLHDENQLFEFLILEGVQAGLSWSTVLQRRENYRRLYDNFDPDLVANYSQKKIDDLLSNPKLIRNKLKINASVKNAKAFLHVQNKPIINFWETHEHVPNETDTSILLSRDLKKRGFSFVGPTICYALMQATGLVNDHLTTCFRHKELT